MGSMLLPFTLSYSYVDYSLLNNAICTEMDGPQDCDPEWSQSDQERQLSHGIA